MNALRASLAVALGCAAALVFIAPAGAALPVLPVTSAPLKTVKIGAATLGYRVLGRSSRPPLVMITGYAATAAEWDPALLHELARTRRLVIFDNRGMGNSTGPVGALSVGQMAGDTARLIAALKLKRPDILGWSMGGYIAQVLALQSPQSVRRLILASTDPGSSRATPPSAAVLAVLENPDATAATLDTVLFPADQQAAGAAWNARIGATPNLTAADFSTPGPVVEAQSVAAGEDWLGPGDGTYARLPRLKARTLVAYGSRDVVVPPANARLLTARIPHVQSRRFTGAGHAFLFQDPITVGRRFTGFLR